MSEITTKDCDKFYFLEYNRDIDWKHVADIKASMKEKYLHTVIEVTKDLGIIDGQHRFIAIRELNLPLKYHINNDFEMQDMMKLNQLQRNWGNKDYLKAYSYKKNYKLYIEFVENYKIEHSGALSLLTNGSKAHPMFKKGELQIPDYAYSCKLAEEFIAIMKVAPITYNKASFLRAYKQCRNNPEFKFEVFMEKLLKNPDALRPQVNAKGVVENIENIYNYRSKNPINLRFYKK